MVLSSLNVPAFFRAVEQMQMTSSHLSGAVAMTDAGTAAEDGTQITSERVW
jgi:hypothetical protein